MNNFQQRKVTFLSLPLGNDTIIKPEQVILMYGKNRTLDIGSLCYLERKRKRLQNEGLLVKIESLSKKRVQYIRQIINIISNDWNYSGLSPNSVYSYSMKFIYFVSWADDNKYCFLFDTPAQSKQVFSLFVLYLKDRLAKNELSSSSATAYQNTALQVLEKLHDVDNLSHGIPSIREKVINEYTSPPLEDSQSKILSLCENIFEGITDFILTNKDFPYQLTVPSHIGWEDNSFYIFPIMEWAVSPNNYKDKQGWIWNQKEGRINTKEEIRGLYKNENLVRAAVYKAKKLLNDANANPYTVQRLRLATVAHHAFAIIFLATTGMNKEGMLNLLWDNNYEISSEKQGFRTIKHRAGNKICHFELSLSMLPKFKKFLELRKYLLNNQPSEYLFISLGPKLNKSPSQLNGAALLHIFETLQKMDSSISKITPRQWRAAKSDWLVKNTDISTAALILQNSEKVLLKHYTAGSQTSQLSELTNFFSEIANVVLKENTAKEGQSSSVGLCVDYGNPNAIITAPVKVNCKSPEGCLFCDKYRIHADERDTRKLVSCRYCIRKVAQLSNSKEEYDAIFKPIFERIDNLIKEIELSNPNLTTKIIKEVEEMGELDSYWARKLELLFDLGVVI